jgi:hypothetical protein
MTVLETPRLLLRPMTLDDLQEKFMSGQHPDVYRFDGFVLLENGQKRPRTREETQHKMEQRIAEFAPQGFGPWCYAKRPPSLDGLACNSPYLTLGLSLLQKSSSFMDKQGPVGERVWQLKPVRLSFTMLARPSSCVASPVALHVRTSTLSMSCAG